MFMYIEESVLTSHIRVYAEGNTLKNRDPYEAILTVQYLNDNAVHISGLKGAFNRSVYRSIERYFNERGIIYVSYERHNKKKIIAR